MIVVTAPASPSGESGLPAPALAQLVPQQVQVGAEPELARERLPWALGAPGGQGPTLSVQPESREGGGTGRPTLNLSPP